MQKNELQLTPTERKAVLTSVWGHFGGSATWEKELDDSGYEHVAQAIQNGDDLQAALTYVKRLAPASWQPGSARITWGELRHVFDQVAKVRTYRDSYSNDFHAAKAAIVRAVNGPYCQPDVYHCAGQAGPWIRGLIKLGVDFTFK